MDADHARLLFAYNRWANALVLDQATKANGEAYFAPTSGLSFGNLHATLVHILLAEIVWLARWQGAEAPPALANARRADRIAATEVTTFVRMLELWRAEETKQDALLAALTDADLARPVTYRLADGHVYTNPMGQQMAHLVNHGTQFRAEAAVRLTQLGLSPGDIDLMAYVRQQG